MDGKIGDEADVTKHNAILSNLPNDPIGIFIGKQTGEILVTLSMYRSGTSTSENTASYDSKRMWYSANRVDFVEINGNLFPELISKPNNTFYMFCGANSQGRILCDFNTSSSAGGSFESRNLLPSVFLDNYVRQLGFDCNFKS